MNRRRFLQKTAYSSALLGLSGIGMSALSLPNKKHITILHTNDVHSHIEPFPPSDPKHANMGGAARRASIVAAVRKENPNTLLLDAGDIFQGTPYFNFYGGQLEFRLMSKMGYNAATIGNHDFDNGLEGLLSQMPYADFKLLSANYDFSNTVMEGYTKPYDIFERDGVRIGIFGLGIQLNGLVNKELYKETNYLNPIEIAQDMSRILKSEKNCDLVICLSHLGYSYDSPATISDITLAQQTENIDLIIGGHTHTFLEKPTLVQNREGSFVLVNQVGWGGIQLGRIDFYLDTAKTTTKSTLFDIS